MMPRRSLVFLMVIFMVCKGQRYTLSFFTSGDESTPTCQPTAEKEVVIRSAGDCVQSIFNPALFSKIGPANRVGFDVLIRTFSDASCSTQTHERYMKFLECGWNGDARSFQVTFKAMASTMAVSFSGFVLVVFALFL